LQRNPETSGNDAEVLAPNLDQADVTAKRLAVLPEVSRTLTLSSFIPTDQDQKIAAIISASQGLGAALNPKQQQPAPSDENLVAAMRATSADLLKAAGNASGAAADSARHVSGLLTRLAQSDTAARNKAGAAIVPPLIVDLDQLRNSLDPQPVTVKTLPPDLIRAWLSPDGRARVQVLPKGELSDTHGLRKFATIILAAAPSATGPAISYYESGETVTRAFIEAGILALASIAVLLFIALRRVTDVLLTLVPFIARRDRDAGGLRDDRTGSKLCEYHRATVAAWSRGRVQDLLHDGVACRKDRAASVDLDAGRDLQRHDQCHRLWKHGGVTLSGHVQHGQAHGFGVVLYIGRRGAVPAGSYGTTAATQSRFGPA